MHQDKRDNEIFLGNHSGKIVEHLRNLRTLRLGKQAFFIDGKPIPDSQGYHPMFIHKSEHDQYDRIMMDQFNKIRRPNKG